MATTDLPATSSHRKRCSLCCEQRPLTAFNKATAAKDGLQSRCRECASSENLRWRTENPEKESSRKHRWRASNQHVQDAATRRWRENNAEQRAETSRLWRERNKDRHDEATKRWRANNPERQKETARLHKSRLEYRVRHAERQRARRAQGYIPLDEYLAWLDAQPRTCFYCDGDCASEYHIDHFVPLALGGWHALSNLTVACPGCNLRKGAKDPLDFMQEMRCANHPNDNDP